MAAGESRTCPEDIARLAVEIGVGEAEVEAARLRWLVEPDWAGETCALIAGGPSLTREQVEKVSHLRTIGVNDAYRIARLDVLYACDEKWWDAHEGTDFAGIKATQSEKAARKWGLRWLKNTGTDGLDMSPGSIRTGKNGGYQALNLALQLGARRILLLGYDMTCEKGRHWFGDHPAPLAQFSEFTLAGWRKCFNDVAPVIRDMGVEVINCTPGSALECFEKMDVSDAIRA